MYHKIIAFCFLFIFYNGHAFAQSDFTCGTPEMDIEDAKKSVENFETWRLSSSRDTYPVMILVAWHVIYSTSNEGYLSQSHIEGSIESMNY